MGGRGGGNNLVGCRSDAVHVNFGSFNSEIVVEEMFHPPRFKSVINNPRGSYTFWGPSST